MMETPMGEECVRQTVNESIHVQLNKNRQRSNIIKHPRKRPKEKKKKKKKPLSPSSLQTTFFPHAPRIKR